VAGRRIEFHGDNRAAPEPHIRDDRFRSRRRLRRVNFGMVHRPMLFCALRYLRQHCSACPGDQNHLVSLFNSESYSRFAELRKLLPASAKKY
jgi:hypothetical protein